MPRPPLATASDLRVWMQQIEDRLARLEGARSVTVGGWVLAERNGNVELMNVASGTVVVLTP